MTLRTLQLLLLGAVTLVLTACGRQYSVSVNENVLFDPRARQVQVHFDDPGLQSCVNVRLRQQEYESVDQLRILSCSYLEIRNLDGIEVLRNLEFLDVGDNELVHLDALRRLDRLASVRAPNNPLDDISGLLALPTLTSAILTGTQSIPCTQLDQLAERLGEDLLRPVQCAN